MKKISTIQQRTLDKIKTRKEYSAYDLQESLATLHSLVKLGLLNKREELGSIFSPRTGIKFSLTK